MRIQLDFLFLLCVKKEKETPQIEIRAHTTTNIIEPRRDIIKNVSDLSRIFPP